MTSVHFDFLFNTFYYVFLIIVHSFLLIKHYLINVDVWLNRSVTLSMAETERYDIVLFSRVASLTGSSQTSNELCESKIAGKL